MTEVNIMEHIGSDGKFAETFKDQIPAIAGEEFKDTGIFNNIGDVGTLIKSFANSERKIAEKMSSVIQKPGENATDEEKAEYVTALRKALGAPESGDDYDFAKPDDLPEGMGYSEETVKAFRELLASEGTPVSTAKLLWDMYNKSQIARFQARLEEENKIFLQECESLDNDWKGDDMVKNGRTAYAAMMEFCTEDLTKTLKESKIYEDAGNHEKWNELGFNPQQRRIWERIGRKMKSKEPIPDEGGTPEGDKDKKTLIDQTYDHPTSVRAREQRSKK